MAKTVLLVIVAIIVTAAIFIGQQKVFPPAETPPPGLLPVFIFLSFWDALAFGIGIALLIYLMMSYGKWPKPVRGWLLLLFIIGLWFMLMNWIHDGLHISGFAMPPNFSGLAITEFLFHVPWLIIGTLLVVAALKLSRKYASAQ